MVYRSVHALMVAFLSTFTKVGTVVITPKSKNELIRGHRCTISSTVLPQNPDFRPGVPENLMQILIALYLDEHDGDFRF